MTMADQDATADTPPVPTGAPIGPGSLTWRHFGDRRGLMFLARTGTLQNMHPAVGAALQQHSNFFDDPWDRLFRSLPPIMGVVYDPPDVATGTTVRDLHTDLKGTDSHGRRYHALHPDVFWWTHATFVESIIAGQEYFGTPLTPVEKDQLIAESVTWWQRYGLSMRPVLTTYAEFEAYWQRMLDEELERNATTDYALAMDTVLLPPPPLVPWFVWPLVRRPLMRFNGWLLNALMPERAREILGLVWTDRDERRFRRFAGHVRRVWPLVPRRLGTHPRAYVNMRRVERGC